MLRLFTFKTRENVLVMSLEVVYSVTQSILCMIFLKYVATMHHLNCSGHLTRLLQQLFLRNCSLWFIHVYLTPVTLK